MLDDILMYTLLQSPTYELEYVYVDGSEFFDMLVSDYEALCTEKNIQLTAKSFVSGTYYVNPKQMMRVADNLMSNALQHTTSDRRIWLVATSDHDAPLDWLFDFVKQAYTFDYTTYTYLIVQNEGEGVPTEKLAHIFNPLYQVDQARSKKHAHGTGLGLSITQQIIEKHGGKVDVFSKQDIGTCFICSLRKVKGVDDE